MQVLVGYRSDAADFDAATTRYARAADSIDFERADQREDGVFLVTFTMAMDQGDGTALGVVSVSDARLRYYYYEATYKRDDDQGVWVVANLRRFAGDDD